MANQFTDAEKLDFVERLIVHWRKEARAQLRADGGKDWLILKSIAADLRAKSPDVKNRALFALGIQIENARAAKARLGYIEVGHMQAMAEALMAHWPAVKKALSRDAETV